MRTLSELKMLLHVKRSGKPAFFHLRGYEAERLDFQLLSTHPWCQDSVDNSGPAEGQSDGEVPTGMGAVWF